MTDVDFTMLNSMADADFDAALERHREWGIRWVDLRDQIYGKRIADLTIEEAIRARAAIDEAGLEVVCLSTGVFFEDVANGEEAFRRDHLGRLDHLLEISAVLRPRFFRLIAAQLPEREQGRSAVAILKERYPWVVEVYREAIDRVAASGATPTIENEAFSCFLSETRDFVDFFAWLDRPSVTLTWDVNNQWATGVFPTIDDYEALRPLISYYHLKGGQTNGGSDALAWNSALEDSDFAVEEITRRVIDDGVSPVICLNPSQHGRPKPGYDYADLALRDLRYLQSTFSRSIR
ncbi:sugar phosphate isomerase/epimerase family protein [Agromyces sp. GXQ0307]|uniref:sugar phosphate isomerase/epimerase family protein n=1 Tax=Agromyces sp. GXQ0307 TaxID=3377835 RepID=UPI00383A52DB